MAIIDIVLRPRQYERELARNFERRSPQEGAFPSTAASTSSVPEASPTVGPHVYQLSTSTKTLATIVSVLGAIIIGIVIWRIIAWRRRKQNAASSLMNKRSSEKAHTSFLPSMGKGDLEANLQQPQKAVLFPVIPRASAGVNWVSQIKPKIYVHYDGDSKSVDGDSSDEESDEMSEKPHAIALDDQGPPSYTKNGKKIPSFADLKLPPPPAPRDSKFGVPAPPTPPASFKSKRDSSRSSIPGPLPSPRSSSFSAQQASAKSKYLSKTFARNSTSSAKAKKLPRLMTVVTSFTPSMGDELPIQTGETLRLLEEYEDEWCLVQRVGQRDGEKGVIPRFCLVERLVMSMSAANKQTVPAMHKHAILLPTSFAR